MTSLFAYLYAAVEPTVRRNYCGESSEIICVNTAQFSRGACVRQQDNVAALLGYAAAAAAAILRAAGIRLRKITRQRTRCGRFCCLVVVRTTVLYYECHTYALNYYL